MNKRIKKLWVDALRSGDYKQGTGALRVGDEFCCLGVLCNLHAQEFPEKRWADHPGPMELWSYMGKIGFPPHGVLGWAEMYPEIYQLTELANANDRMETFQAIADRIELTL